LHKIQPKKALLSTFGIMGKRIASILTLAILLVHLAGFYVYFVVRLGEVRMEMRKKLAELPDEKLQVVVIPREAFRASWLDELEMKWNGRMYDIARVEHDNDVVRVYGLHDEDEDGLLNFLAAVVESSQHDTQEAPGSLVQFFTLEYVLHSELLPGQPESQMRSAETRYCKIFSSFAPDPVSPPPRA